MLGNKVDSYCTCILLIVDLLTLFLIANLMTDNCWRVDSTFVIFPVALLSEVVLVALAYSGWFPFFSLEPVVSRV